MSNETVAQWNCVLEFVIYIFVVEITLKPTKAQCSKCCRKKNLHTIFVTHAFENLYVRVLFYEYFCIGTVLYSYNHLYEFVIIRAVICRLQSFYFSILLVQCYFIITSNYEAEFQGLYENIAFFIMLSNSLFNSSNCVHTTATIKLRRTITFI